MKKCIGQAADVNNQNVKTDVDIKDYWPIMKPTFVNCINFG